MTQQNTIEVYFVEEISDFSFSQEVLRDDQGNIKTITKKTRYLQKLIICGALE